jgi:hypothetical protein
MYLLPMLIAFLDSFTARKRSDLRDVSAERTPSTFGADSLKALEMTAKQSTPHTLQLPKSSTNIYTGPTIKSKITVLTG